MSYCSCSHPGLDPRPAVFGVVKTLHDSSTEEDSAHTDQQVSSITDIATVVPHVSDAFGLYLMLLHIP